MLKKGNIIIIIIFLIFLVCVSSKLTFGFLQYDYYFDQNKVIAVGYSCHDENCTQENTNTLPWSQSITQTNNGIIRINYPSPYPSDQVTWYLVRFHSPGYITKFWILKQQCSGGASTCGPYRKPASGTFNFIKIPLCKSDVGNIEFENNIYKDQPIVISVPANLSADTSSALKCYNENGVCNISFVPPSFEDYYSAQTNVILTIKNSAEQLVHTQTIEKNILWKTTESVKFDSWTPSTPDTYTVTVTTHVTDDQCASYEDDSASSRVIVWEHYPKNECWTDIQGLTAQSSASSPLVNQPLTINFQTRSQYAPNYDPWDAEYSTYKKKVATNTNVFLGFGNDWQLQQNKLISASLDWGVYEPVQLTFTPTRSGTLKIKVNGTAQDQVCNNKLNTLSSEPTYYDIEIKECASGSTRTCYTGADNTLNKGICVSGTQTCNSNGYYSGECVGQIIPSLETCDGKDNDCDGTTDEDCSCVNGQTKSCSELFSGICAVGTATCTNGQWSGCPAPRTEECTDATFLDEDCDGQANCYDTGSCPQSIWRDIFNPCTDSCPEGSYDLDGDNVCECTKTNNGIETCDDLDNDCNGVVDDIMNLPYCYSEFPDTIPNVGVCANMKTKCISQLGRLDCSFTNYERPSETSCDNLDNDCDGQVDENLIQSTNQRGACSNNKQTCINGKYVNDTTNIRPTEDICGDNIDNNCDGNVDETCLCTPGETKGCGDTDVGQCEFGIQTCKADKTWGVCSAVYPALEICDGLDNDCDGNTDEPASCCLNGRTRECINDNCPDIQGAQTCKDYVWDECIADCPVVIQPTEITLLSPKENRIYTTCKDTKTKPVEFSYIAGVQCYYKTQWMKSYSEIENRQAIDFPIGNNVLSIKCEDKIKTIGFTVKKGEECTNYTFNTNTGDLIIDFTELNLSDQDIQDAEETSDILDQSMQVSYDEDGTTITHTLIPSKELGEVDIALFIPKCLTPYLKDLELDLSGYTVIKEDPLIAWHFVNVKNKIELSYRINKQVPEDCLKQIKLLPIAKLIGDKLNNKPFGLDKFLLPSIIIAIGASLIIYMQRFHPDVLANEEDEEKKGIETGMKHLLNEVKEQRFKSKEQAENYMTERGFSEEEKEYIRKRI